MKSNIPHEGETKIKTKIQGFIRFAFLLLTYFYTIKESFRVESGFSELKVALKF